MAKAIEGKLTYLKSSNFLRRWTVRECEVCDLADVKLSSARPAPRVAHARPKEVPPRANKTVPARKKLTSEDRLVNLLNMAFATADAVSRFSDWVRSPAPPPAPLLPPAPPPPPARKPVPPFDIQDVPKAMRKVGMPIAAKLQERWFAGQANYSRSSQDLMDEIDQSGARYAQAMVDSTTVKMEWVLSFARAKKEFDELVNAHLWTPAALEILRRKLMPYRARQDIVAWNVANSDFLAFHQKFQFQFQPVNATWAQRIGEFLDRSAKANGVPDDLTGALGAFNAAVQYAYFDHPRPEVVVTHISVYVRDPYEFSDDQYLGHWSPSHVAVVPAHQLAGGSGWLDYPIVDGSVHEKDAVLYPVTNKDYRDWRFQYAQGGDFMIYTDRVSVKLDRPIRVRL
ncbi:DUF6402 family protein [Variovorax boronicumulans]|uniref:DUF6402 family protein n=1 Tax=Variovorax boronicumulans TaxID=436515 RepID=UPI001C59CE87